MTRVGLTYKFQVGFAQGESQDQPVAVGILIATTRS
jgi:hypothetical protein